MFELASSLLSLIAMEIILGIDNLIFIAVLVERLEEDKRRRTRIIGLSLALFFRILLLFSIHWVMSLSAPIFTLGGNSLSWRDLILLAGGLFLIGKATYELHEHVENRLGESGTMPFAQSKYVIAQIVLLDLIFSLDSVITAIGMAKEIWVMVLAVTIAMGIMMLSAEKISNFVSKHPTIKILALAFLLIIGVTLTAEGMGFPVPKGYIYFTMAFSLSLELLSLRVRAKSGRKKTR